MGSINIHFDYGHYSKTGDEYQWIPRETCLYGNDTFLFFRQRPQANGKETLVAKESLSTLQVFVQVTEKNRKLSNILDTLDFNQLLVYEKSLSRAEELISLIGRDGVKSKRVNFIIHYDTPETEEAFLHRGFARKGVTITFLSSPCDEDILGQIKENLEIVIYDLPEQIDTST
ncbi:hypothetical protein ISN45_Aa01g032160 [Arabidopsis thaliana x Arabidopsis arenosa]|uniref:Uncharacterized protein n=1 Tax=Arabidopsis thaliana x Arabidopsis arenosa TaxID=1240361 RepID=A0A8T2C589_9BRAS|nr:hypothetical protein ISN45_Aa01g032160 [Arabidopsis thaliana x Arabidopsis arenosa]